MRLGNLEPTRDLNFVSNTVDGFLLAASCPAAIGLTLNLGSGREIGIGALAELVGTMLGQETEIVSESARQRPEGSEVERLLADSSQARAVLGWQPKVTLEEGLQETIAWIRRHVEHFRPGEYTL